MYHILAPIKRFSVSISTNKNFISRRSFCTLRRFEEISTYTFTYLPTDVAPTSTKDKEEKTLGWFAIFIRFVAKLMTIRTEYDTRFLRLRVFFFFNQIQNPDRSTSSTLQLTNENMHKTRPL